jgi:hypothetical protein
MSEVSPRELVYTYGMSFSMARANFNEARDLQVRVREQIAAEYAEGRLVAYGDDEYMIHPLGKTHSIWITAGKPSEVLALASKLERTLIAQAPILSAPQTRYEATFTRSAHYGWKSGAVTDGYAFVAYSFLKKSEPTAKDCMASFYVPLFEQMMTGGFVTQYQIDVEAIHTTQGGLMLTKYAGTGPEIVDAHVKWGYAAMAATPLLSPAVKTMFEPQPHYDFLSRTNFVCR